MKSYFYKLIYKYLSIYIRPEDSLVEIDPKNNFLNEVIDKKSGLPITISILYIEIAKFIGLDLKIIGFPSHILVKYNEEMILDPFNDGMLLEFIAGLKLKMGRMLLKNSRIS